MDVPSDDERLSAYELEQWRRLNDYWAKRANARGTPAWLSEGAHAVADGMRRGGRAVADRVPDRVKEVATDLGEKAVEPTVAKLAASLAALLELINDVAMELQDPQSVVDAAYKRGLEVSDIADLRKLDLKDCDQLLSWKLLQARGIGALDGAAMGALALVPVAGVPAAVGLDILVMNVLTAAAASRVAYSYGFDAKDPAERDFITALVTRSLGEHAVRARAFSEASKATRAAAGRKKWSDALRRDHRLIAATERFMGQWYKGGKVPVGHVAKALPVISIVVGAGSNAHMLGAVTKHSQYYCQTRFLAEKGGLPLPEALRDPGDGSSSGRSSS